MSAHAGVQGAQCQSPRTALLLTKRPHSLVAKEGKIHRDFDVIRSIFAALSGFVLIAGPGLFDLDQTANAQATNPEPGTPLAWVVRHQGGDICVASLFVATPKTADGRSNDVALGVRLMDDSSLVLLAFIAPDEPLFGKSPAGLYDSISLRKNGETLKTHFVLSETTDLQDPVRRVFTLVPYEMDCSEGNMSDPSTCDITPPATLTHDLLDAWMGATDLTFHLAFGEGKQTFVTPEADLMVPRLRECDGARRNGVDYRHVIEFDDNG